MSPQTLTWLTITRLSPRSSSGRPSVYQVSPVGAISPDPDYPQGGAFRCQRARIVAVSHSVDPAPPHGTPQPKYLAWDDGTRLYNDDGFAQPNMLLRHFGITDGDLFVLGRDADFFSIEQHGRRLIKQRHSLTDRDTQRLRFTL